MLKTNPIAKHETLLYVLVDFDAGVGEGSVEPVTELVPSDSSSAVRFVYAGVGLDAGVAGPRSSSELGTKLGVELGSLVGLIVGAGHKSAPGPLDGQDDEAQNGPSPSQVGSSWKAHADP